MFSSEVTPSLTQGRAHLLGGTMAIRFWAITLVCVVMSACGKVGVSGHWNRAFGNWAEVRLPPGCTARQIAADENGGVSILCEDGRVFH